MTIKSKNSGCVVKASIASGDVVTDAVVCMARSATYCRFLRRWPIGSDQSHGQTANMTAMPVAAIAASFEIGTRRVSNANTATMIGKNTAFVFVANASPHSTPAPTYQRHSPPSHATKYAMAASAKSSISGKSFTFTIASYQIRGEVKRSATAAAAHVAEVLRSRNAKKAARNAAPSTMLNAWKPSKTSSAGASRYAVAMAAVFAKG